MFTYYVYGALAIAGYIITRNYNIFIGIVSLGILYELCEIKDNLEENK
jgi:hypothetical protein